jgi:hypothetical protein
MKKKTLYEIDQEYIILMDQLEEAEGILDETLERMLEISEQNIAEKAEAYAMMITQWEGEAQMIRDEELRLAKRRKAKENSIARLESRLSSSMKLFGKEKIEGKLFTIGFRRSTRMEQTDGDMDPLKFLADKWITTVRKVDTSAIGAELKAGGSVDGFALVEYKNLTIK